MFICSYLLLTTDILGAGGGKRTRTADILLAKQALYQLSYTPALCRLLTCRPLLAQLAPVDFLKWAILDSNQGPHPYQGCALTT
jgi:hypothetical protein